LVIYQEGLLNIHLFLIHYFVITVIAVIMTSCNSANKLHVEILKYLIHKN